MNSYASHGSYMLEELVLTTQTDEIDLSSMFVSLSLYESMEEQAMSGTITVIDSFNLPDILQLGGNEQVTLSFYTSGNENNPLEYTGTVYKLSERHRLSEHSSGYLIHFCSDVALSSRREFLTRAFNTTISDAVKRILNIYTDKAVDVVETAGTYSYSFGNTEALEAINLMIPKAYSTSNEVGYVLYETPNQWNFKPLEWLYQQQPVASYGTKSAHTYENVSNRYAEQFESIQNVKILEENSLMDSVNDGMYGSSHQLFDILNKTYTEDVYSVNEQFDPEKSLGYTPTVRPFETKNDQIFLRYDNNNTDNVNNRTYSRTKMVLRRSDLFRAEITLFGDSSISVGNIISVTFPTWVTDQENIGTMFDGEVLIKKICHYLTPNQYLQVMQVNKDAYNEGVS